MSFEFEGLFDLFGSSRQKINNDRVRNNTEKYYERYSSICNELISQGFDKFIPEEIKRLQSDLDSIQENLEDNPFAARDISMQVQNYIYGLRSLARNAKGNFERAERERIKKIEEEEKRQRDLETKHRNEIITAMNKEYLNTIKEIENPAVQNFCENDLKIIKDKIDSGNISDISVLKKELNSAINKAEKQAEEWKQKALKEVETEAIKQETNEIKSIIENQVIEDVEKKEKIIKTIEELKKNNMPANNIKQEINKIQKEIEEVLINEDVRREAVKAIYKQLKSQNFTVEPPKLFKNGNEDFVKIVAKMPSGKKAVCNLTNKGKIVYKFDNYEGMTCLKDIQKFNVDLEKIYSVKLSNDRVLWSNPDRIGKDADKIPNSSNEQKR